MKFGRKVVGLTNRSRHDTHNGELRTPIVLMRSERTPDAETAFTQKLVPYHPAFAKVETGEERREAGDSSDPTPVFHFTIRNPIRVEVNANDIVSWGDRLFLIKQTREIGLRQEWLRIKAHAYQNTSGPAFGLGAIQNEDGTPIEQTEPDPGQHQSPFWPPEE